MQVMLLALCLAAEPSEVKAVPRATFGFDRVDLVSEDRGTWLNYDLPMFSGYALSGVVRLVEQVKVSLRLPWQGFYLGLSIASQSLTFEGAIARRLGLFWTVGLQTRLLFPAGVLAGVAWRVAWFRVGVSVSAFTTRGWANLSGSGSGAFPVHVLPTIGLGVGRAFENSAEGM